MEISSNGRQDGMMNFAHVSGHGQCLLILSIILDKNSYHDFLIIPTISGKADNYRLLLKKGRDNFFKKGRYLIARIQMP